MAKSNTTTTFEKMGDNFGAHVMNLSGAPSPYTTSVGKKGGGKSVQTSGKNAIKGRTMIKGANGPACHIKATLYAPNAASAGEQTRNIRILPSAVGSRDFSPSSYGKVN